MKKYPFLIVLVITLGGCAGNGMKTTEATSAVPPGSGGTLVIQPITFKDESDVRDAVKQECNLDGKLADFIKEYAAGQYASIVVGTDSKSADAQLLSIQIEGVRGPGGGAWSGPKDVVISGSLSRNGQVLGDFKARRYSTGGMFAGFKGTCAILGRCVKALGRDVAEWLRNPAPHALLGDM